MKDPNAVDAEWREFFAGLNDDPGAVEKIASGPSWASADWPNKSPMANWSRALDGDWAELETTSAQDQGEGGARKPPASRAADLQRATRDSVRALMMIRAYRMRGHLHANLDPLGFEQRQDHGELHPATYGFTEADYDRKIFIDGVLGLEFATSSKCVAILRRTYCGTIGFEFMHISDPDEKAWFQARIEGRGRRSSFTLEGKRAILTQAHRGGGLREISRRQIYRHQALRPRRRRSHRSRRWSRSSSAAARWASRRSCSAWRIAAGSMCSAR